MKNTGILLIILAGFALANCGKDTEEDRYALLTGRLWTTDSLLVNGADAGNPGQFLAKFKGTARFNADGSGTFGIYKGTWRFPDKTRSQIVLTTDSLPLPLTTNIVELTEKSLKITTAVPDITGQTTELKLRMTFKAQ